MVDSLRWGLLSTARINERMIPAIRQSARSDLLAVASRAPERARAYAGDWKIPRAYGSYAELLADRDIDIVYVSLPNSDHAEWSIACARAGKHILCEKPLALTPSEVDAMAAAAGASGVVLQEGAMYRYHPQLDRVKALLEEGAIGQLRLIQCNFGFTLLNDPDIRRQPERGGGALWDIGSYPVSLSRAVVGEEPSAVAAWQTERGGVDMTFAGQLLFPSGVISQFNCSFETVPHWHGQLVGSNGMIHLDHPYLNQVGYPARIEVLRGGSADQVTFGDNTDHLQRQTIVYEECNAYAEEVKNLEAVLLDGGDPAISVSFSRGNVVAVNALYVAARERRMVNLNSDTTLDDTGG